MPKAWRRALGKPQFGGVKNSDDWFSKDGSDGVEFKHSSFVPSQIAAKNDCITINCGIGRGAWRIWNASKICDSLNPCAAHKN